MDDLMATSACTLPTVERPLRLAEFDALFSLATSVEYDGSTARLHFSGPPTLRDEVVELTARESQCCSFFAFSVEGTDSEVDLGIGASTEHEPLVAALVARAEELSK
jgi:hypothetical protein